jgi:multidrug efflux pump subunit AcrA (membrane-fusion protein)
MLKSGMYVFVTIITPQKVKSIIIPQSSILFEDNIKSIYKINVETMSVVKQVVTSSKKYGEYAEVTSGLNTGDVVITKEAREVFSGCRVNFKLINLESRIKKVLTTKVFKGCIR